MDRSRPEGPASASATARAASERQRRRRPRPSATPGSAGPADRRPEEAGLVDGLGRPDVVELGRSVGRADEQGTRAWWASTTAGCSSTAAVPLVVQTTAGRPVARPSPRAKKPAPRSSRRTWSRSSARAARARARGVEREPGQTTASVSPARTHSSTRVAAKVACTGRRRSVRSPPLVAAAARRDRRGRPAAGAGPRLHPDRAAVGAASARPLAGHHQLVRVDLPGHGGSSDVRADLPAGGALLAAVADGDARSTCSATRWAPASPSTRPWRDPTGCAGWC